MERYTYAIIVFIILGITLLRVAYKIRCINLSALPIKKSMEEKLRLLNETSRIDYNIKFSFFKKPKLKLVYSDHISRESKDKSFTVQCYPSKDFDLIIIDPNDSAIKRQEETMRNLLKVIKINKE